MSGRIVGVPFALRPPPACSLQREWQFSLPGPHMMMQLNPPLPLDTPKGPAFAHMVLDYGQEHYVLFVCFICETGECWVYPNKDARAQKNVTMGVRARPDCTCHTTGERAS